MVDTLHGSGPESADDHRQRDDAPILPYAKAFVVQFTAETDDRLKHATGRVEHLQTGRRLRFVSIGELLINITTMLADGHPAPAKRERPAASRKRERAQAPKRAKKKP